MQRDEIAARDGAFVSARTNLYARPRIPHVHLLDLLLLHSDAYSIGFAFTILRVSNVLQFSKRAGG